MRLLLDEQVPRVFADCLAGHVVATTQAMGWSALENGDLLRTAADAGFDALLTLDRGIEFQQNLAVLPLSVLIVRARSNRIDDLEPLAGEVLASLEALEPRSLVRIGV